jgi:NAD(P)-dependent dehydrogenase (short-subunit alcohol dehydrogenase family)
VITGGNTGLGLACANAILQSPHGAPWQVVLACREEGRAQAAVDQLTRGAGVAGQVEAMLLDLASLASVRAFAAELSKKLSTGTTPPLHAVVCNAGVNSGTTQTATADGFESTFGINHLGHFLLINELLPTLQSPARVVVVASGVLGAAAASDNSFVSGQRRYSTSKLANVYFTYALARRLPVR